MTVSFKKSVRVKRAKKYNKFDRYKGYQYLSDSIKIEDGRL
jgi:hypothetical protein